MSLPPLLERELRVAFRKKRPVRRRFVTALVGLLVVFGSQLDVGVGASALLSAGNAGGLLHKLLCVGGLIVILAAPGLVAGAFAAERREGTLGLLFLSGLSALETFASKALSALLIGFTQLLALFPLLALPFLMGGVSWDLFLSTVCGLPALLILTLSLTLLGSVLTEDEGAAQGAAAGMMALLCALPSALYFALTHLFPGGASVWWLRSSPAYAAWLIWQGTPRWPEVAACLSFTLAWSGLAFAAAAVAMSRLWREQASGRPARWNTAWRRLIHGTMRHRRDLAAQWLDRNPFVWLCARDRQGTALAWAVVISLVAGWLWCWAIWGARWFNLMNLLVALALLNAALRWVICYAAAKALADPRRDGSFELLLTMPLDACDVVNGALLSLNQQFCRVGRWVFGFEAVVLLAAVATRRWSLASLFVYGVCGLGVLMWAWPAALGWREPPAVIPGVGYTAYCPPGWGRALTCLWAGLNCGRPLLALRRSAQNPAWLVPVYGYNLYMFGHVFGGFATFPSGSRMQVIYAAGVSAIVLLGLWLQSLGWKANPVARRLVVQFREVACEPLPDPDDPSLKYWRGTDRLSRTTRPHWLLRDLGG